MKKLLMAPALLSGTLILSNPSIAGLTSPDLSPDDIKVTPFHPTLYLGKATQHFKGGEVNWAGTFDYGHTTEPDESDVVSVKSPKGPSDDVICKYVVEMKKPGEYELQMKPIEIIGGRVPSLENKVNEVKELIKNYKAHQPVVLIDGPITWKVLISKPELDPAKLDKVEKDNNGEINVFDSLNVLYHLTYSTGEGDTLSLSAPVTLSNINHIIEE